MARKKKTEEPAPNPEKLPRQAEGRAHGIHKWGVMNQQEARYARMLEQDKRNGDIIWYEFEGIRLKLGDGAWYTPDFLVMRKDGVLECHEVKGHWEEAARVRIKVAATKFPFLFVAITQGKGGEVHQEFFDTDASRCRECKHFCPTWSTCMKVSIAGSHVHVREGQLCCDQFEEKEVKR